MQLSADALHIFSTKNFSISKLNETIISLLTNIAAHETLNIVKNVQKVILRRITNQILISSMRQIALH